MSTAATLRLLDLSGALRLGNSLILDGLDIRRILLSHGATEALLLGTALRIALAAPAKTAAARLGRKGANDALVKQLIGVDVLARSRFHRNRRLDNVLDGLFGSLGRLLLDIANLGINGIERWAPVNAAALDLGNDLCRDKFIAHRLGVTFLIDGTENLCQRARLDLERLAAEQVVGNQLGTLGRKRRLAAQTLSQGIDVVLVIGIYRLGHGAPFICTHICLHGTTHAPIHAKYLREHPGTLAFAWKKAEPAQLRTRPFRVI